MENMRKNLELVGLIALLLFFVGYGVAAFAGLVKVSS